MKEILWETIWGNEFINSFEELKKESRLGGGKEKKQGGGEEGKAFRNSKLFSKGKGRKRFNYFPFEFPFQRRGRGWSETIIQTHSINIIIKVLRFYWWVLDNKFNVGLKTIFFGYYITNNINRERYWLPIWYILFTCELHATLHT